MFYTESLETWIPVPAYVGRDDKDNITFGLPRMHPREEADGDWGDEGMAWIAGSG